MKAVKIYGLIWLSFITTTGVVYLNGAITTITLPIFGFAFGTLFFMGLVAVLPFWLKDHFAPKVFKKPTSAISTTQSPNELDKERFLRRIAFQSH